MSTKGQHVVSARLPDALWAELCEYIVAHNERPGNIAWNIADAVVAAVIEMVHHRRRGKGEKTRRPVSPSPGPGEKRIMDELAPEDLFTCQDE